jgi:AAA domain/CHC2 zinc finger
MVNTSPQSAAYEACAERARSVPIESELERRGIRLRREGRELIGPCPRCGGDDRFGVNTSKQVFNCRGCGAKGDVIDLVKFLDGCDFVRAVTTLAGEPPAKANGKAQAAPEPREVCPVRYDYSDENGVLLFQVGRVEYQYPDGSFVLKDGKRKKVFPQKRPDPDRPGKWIRNVDGVCIVPYRLPGLIEAISNDHLILIVEGEGKVDFLRSWNVPATCNAMGAGKWRSAHSEFLRGADVVILPDNDDPGREHANIVGASLQGIAKSIRVLALPDLPPKGDVVDWARQGGTVEQLYDLIAHEARPWTPAGDATKAEPAPDWQVSSAVGSQELEKLLPILQSKKQFLADYIVPDWLLDGILQRRFVYSLTARTGDGKTAVAQLITKLVSMPDRRNAFLGRHAVDHGNVVYFAGENPDDLRMRIIADDAKDDRSAAADNCSFIVGTFTIAAMFAECKAKAATMPAGKIDLVIVDTSAAYFLGEEENSNTQLGAHARTLRTLTELPGQPCVLVLCHPIKNAADQTQLLPRGGGAFIAEMDGNLTLWRTDEVTELWHTGKLRGPGFEPMTFRLEKIICDALIDKKGRHIPTVRAVAISESDKDDLARTTRSNEDRLLVAMLEPGRSVEALASACGWISSGGEAQKSKAHRIIKSLEKSALVRLHRGTYELTDKGKTAATVAKAAAT